MLVSRHKVAGLLSQMQGNYFEHEGKRFKLLSFEFIGSEIKVHTTERMYFQPWSDMYSIITNEFKTPDGKPVLSEAIPAKPEREQPETPIEMKAPTTTKSMKPTTPAKKGSKPATKSKPVALTPKESSPPAVPAVPTAQIETIKLFPKLTQMLFDNIESVRNDKGYCEQAQQVSLSARMIVDIAKTEIEAALAIQGV